MARKLAADQPGAADQDGDDGQEDRRHGDGVEPRCQLVVIGTLLRRGDAVLDPMENARQPAHVGFELGLPFLDTADLSLERIDVGLDTP